MVSRGQVCRGRGTHNGAPSIPTIVMSFPFCARQFDISIPKLNVRVIVTENSEKLTDEAAANDNNLLSVVPKYRVDPLHIINSSQHKDTF